MANEFDPYHKWLGIPKEDQPAHHYRLLAIPLYEDDPQVIEGAADRQMSFLRRYQAGDHAEQARRLLGEVSRARLCLMKPTSKAKYDAKLEQQFAAERAAAESDASESSDDASANVITEIAGLQIQLANRPKSSNWLLPAVVAGGVVGVLIVLAAVNLGGKPGDPQGKVARNGSVPGDEKNSSRTASADRNSDGTEKSPRRPRKDFQARPLATGDKPAWPTLLDKDDPEEGGLDPAKADPNRKTPKPPPKDNLISKLDLKRDVVQGAWKIEDGVLVSPAGYRDRLQIPGKVPAAYTLTVVAERRAESGFGLLTYLPVGKSMVLATIDGWNRETSGLELIDNKEGDVNETMTIGSFTRQGVNNYVYHVQPNQILIEVNGRKVLEWTGDSSLFTINPQYLVPRAGEIGLAVFGVEWRIESVTLVPKPQSKVVANSRAGEPPAFQPAGFKMPIITNAENLIKKMDLARDTVQGKWKIEDDVLLAPNGVRDRIRIPGKVPASYVLTLIAERKQDAGFGLSAILPVGKGQVMATINGWTGRSNGLGTINGKPGDANESTTFARMLKPGLNTFVYRVTPDSVRVEVNGRKATDWKGDSTTLAVHPTYALSKTDELGIVGGVVEWQIFGIKLETGDSQVAPGVAKSATFFDSPVGSLVEKKPIPDQDAMNVAKKAIRELFKTEYAQLKKQDVKINLARNLFSKGQEVGNESAECYVMLSEAADLAAEAGQLGLSWDAINLLGNLYNMNPLPLWERTAKLASPYAKTFDDTRELTRMYFVLTAEAVRLNDYDIASRVMQAATAAVRKPLFAALKDQVAAESKRVAALKDAFEAAKSAREKLQSNATDPAACLAWGRFLCFHKNNWGDGLPLLALGVDPVWSTLAQREMGLNEASPPPESKDIAKLGDDWWDAAEKEKEPIRSLIRDHAIKSYILAQGGAQGLEKTALQQKMDRVLGGAKITETTGDAAGVTIAPVDLNPGNLFSIEFWISTTATTGPVVSKRHLPDGESSIVVSLQDGFVAIVSNADFTWEPETGKTKINDGAWHHVAAVKIGEQLLLFVDGQKEAQCPGRESFSSKSPWKAGCSTDQEPVSVRLARIRLSGTSRYLFPFTPDKQYGKDAGTLLLK
ncbi:MAG: hypothetical protein JWM11_4664 [Planctomycetaceae bacterium]|nr:hypothetical protein [Planctomycetaceae bacterium]